MSVVKLFGRSFVASAVVGVSYLVAIEIAQWVFGYQTVKGHSIVVLLLYLCGIYCNYWLQRKLVFESDQRPVKQFFAYNFLSAFMVSLLSGLFYVTPQVNRVFGPFTEAASTALALLIISPISFIFFKTVFSPEEG